MYTLCGLEIMFWNTLVIWKSQISFDPFHIGLSRFQKATHFNPKFWSEWIGENVCPRLAKDNEANTFISYPPHFNYYMSDGEEG